MLWIDHASYFGPDRRGKRTGLRVREHRRYDYAGQPPSLQIAMRQLRMHVIDARGERATAFAERLKGVALIARMHNQLDVSDTLSRLAATVSHSPRGADVRNSIYAGLDRAYAAMHD